MSLSLMRSESMADRLISAEAGTFSALPRTESEEVRQLDQAIEESLRVSLSRNLSKAARLFGQGTLAETLSRPRSRPEFLCKICYSNDEEEQAYALPCGHRWHKDCLHGYIKSKVGDAQLAILCPEINEDLADRDLAVNGREVGCTEVITEELVVEIAREIGDQELVDRYQKFKELQGDPNMRECPQCKHRQLGCASTPRMTCSSCNFGYCFTHADAHTGATCRQFERKERDATRANERFMLANTLPCPWCEKPTTKNGGCNHMTCSRCHKDWCWVCENGLRDSSWHYDDVNIFGCPGMQFASSFGIAQRYLLYSGRIVATLILLLLLPTAVASAMVAFPCVCCALLCCQDRVGQAIRELVDDYEDRVWFFLALGGWPYVLAMLISALAISPATLIVLSPFLCCCACTGCLDVEDVMDDSKLLIFMTSGLWPYALAIVVLALAAAVASVPLVLPFVLYIGCKTRPALDQDDGHMRTSV